MAVSTVSMLLVLAGLLLLFLILVKRQRRIMPRLPHNEPHLTPAARLQLLRADRRYRGVRIEARCDASQPLQGREFGFDEAPVLPLPDCTAVVCECGYLGLPERRSQPDRRRGSDRRAVAREASSDRRSQRPRRKTDRERQGDRAANRG